MDAMEPLPKSTVRRELDMEEAAEIDEHQPWLYSLFCLIKSVDL